MELRAQGANVSKRRLHICLTHTVIMTSVQSHSLALTGTALKKCVEKSDNAVWGSKDIIGLKSRKYAKAIFAYLFGLCISEISVFSNI